MNSIQRVQNSVYPVAKWWKPEPDQRIRCILCPRKCSIPENSHGFCFIRKNIGGRLYSTGYGRSTGFAVDPMEKKPLYHFYPGKSILSFGTLGCNLGCKYCQNWHISKNSDISYIKDKYEPLDVIRMAQEHDCAGIAYTYNEPVIYAEWVIDIARLAHENGLKNVLVTNGYVTPEARKDLYSHIDAVNVDLKAFSNYFYRKNTLSELRTVLETLNWLIHDSTVWTEITTLLIPGENDGEKEIDQLTKYIVADLDRDVPVHFTAFHPDFKMMNHPPTPLTTLMKAYEIAVNNGLRYVYLGNVHSAVGLCTVCPGCGETLIRRKGYTIQGLDIQAGCCRFCERKIPGWFDPELIRNPLSPVD